MAPRASGIAQRAIGSIHEKSAHQMKLIGVPPCASLPITKLVVVSLPESVTEPLWVPSVTTSLPEVAVPV
jgi:hypothetical protein